MGNPLWSLGSVTDFPPLHIDIPRYQEDMREGEDSDMDTSLGLSFSSENITDSSFQEALTREKVEDKKEDRFKLTVLGRRDSSEPTPHKKVMQEDSGWWSITSDVTSLPNN